MISSGPGLVSARPSNPAVTACVSENRPDWVGMVISQAISIRNLGGSLAASPVRAYFVGGLADPRRHILDDLGVEVVEVERFPSPIPHANKLRMFEAHAASGEGTLIAMDTDVVVLGDLSEQINPNALRGITGGFSPFDEDQWGSWLEERGIRRPSGTSYPMHRTGKTISVPYLDSGVLMVPHRFCAPLVDAWAENVLALVEAFDTPGSALPAEGRFFTDQLALTCALLQADIPVDPMPVGCNFRPGLPTLPLLGVGHVDSIRAVHYHSWGLRDDGYIKMTQYAPVNPELARINQLVATHTGRDYVREGDGLPDTIRSIVDRSAARVERTIGVALNRRKGDSR